MTKKKQLKPIRFAHYYYKLANDEFTTVRGESWSRRVRSHQHFQIEVAGKLFAYCVLQEVEVVPIAELSLQFLKEDAEYPGLEISSSQDFVDLLNSFRRGNSLLTETALVTVLYLRKVSEPPKLTDWLCGGF